ncbi:MAG: NAD(P)/FAD-dependent oxidoreductase [Acidobacteriota bacterium]
MKFGNFETKNNFFMAPIKTALSTPATGYVTEEQIKYYKRRAVGGIGTIILEPISVSVHGKEHPKQMMLNTDEHITGLSKLIEAVHEEGVKAVVHLNHAGRAANPKASGSIFAPSSITCPSTGQIPMELTKEDIDGIISSFCENVRRAEKAGADAIELQFGHGYIVNQFFSEKLNKRSDEYGVDKFKFAGDLLSSIRNISSIPLFLRISGNEFTDGDISGEEKKKTFLLADQYDVSIIHVGWGNACDSPQWYYNHMSLPLDIMDKNLEQIRSLTSGTLIAAGRMHKNNRYDDLVRSGILDGAVFGRQMIIDPDFPKTILSGSSDYIRCGSCLQGCLGNVKLGKPIGCIANPEVHNEFKVDPSESGKIAVIGGGPAGMFGSLYLKQKGYDVVLFEREKKLGGQWILSYKSPGKLSMKDPLDDLINKVENEIDVRTGTNADTDLLLKKNFDKIIVATGAVPLVPGIEGLDNYLTGFDFFNGAEVNGENVVVIGGGLIGLEVTEALVDAGKKVTVVEMLDEIGRGMELVAYKMFLKKYLSKIEVLKNTIVKKIEGKEVFVESDGELKSLGQFDNILITAGTKSDNELYNELSKSLKNVYLIGDAYKVGQIIDAAESSLSIAEEI